MKNKKGFTLSELLIVVATIAILVEISIPIFTSQLHKAKVATDWANLRALYAELQVHATEDGDYSYALGCRVSADKKSITCSDGNSVELEEGLIYMHTGDKQYNYDYYFVYMCDSYHTEHMLLVTNTGVKEYK